ncbi:hypothetical protein FISHEDRAFT_48953, partial [Fistulina hepatica ATCC 64428]
LAHIILHCRVSGQAEIWCLASNLWKNKTGEDLPVASLGDILASGLNNFLKLNDGGAKRLLRILIAESVKLIWSLRCAHRMGTREGMPIPTPMMKEAQQKWLYQINVRLKTDCIHIQTYKGKRQGALRSKVTQTWSNVLDHIKEGDLPSDWMKHGSGVLVGSAALTS